MAQQSVNYKVLTEVISCDPSLPSSPTWPEHQTEKMGNEVLWRGPNPQLTAQPQEEGGGAPTLPSSLEVNKVSRPCSLVITS